MRLSHLTVRARLALAFGLPAFIVSVVSGPSLYSLREADQRFADFVNGDSARASAAAAREIKGLIDGSLGCVAAGEKLVGDAGATMSEIVGGVGRLSDIIAEISPSSAQQGDGLGRINQSLLQLDQMTQQNAALVEQSAAAAASLKSQAQRLVAAVFIFCLSAGANALAHSTRLALHPNRLAA